MKLAITILIILASSLASTYAQCEINKEGKSIEKWEFNEDCMITYIKAFRPDIKFTIADSRAFSNGRKTYLLVKCVTESKGSLIFALKLKVENDTVFMVYSKTLNYCESDKLALDTFLFKNGKISGCSGGNHSISTHE